MKLVICDSYSKVLAVKMCVRKSGKAQRERESEERGSRYRERERERERGENARKWEMGSACCRVFKFEGAVVMSDEGSTRLCCALICFLLFLTWRPRWAN